MFGSRTKRRGSSTSASALSRSASGCWSSPPAPPPIPTSSWCGAGIRSVAAAISIGRLVLLDRFVQLLELLAIAAGALQHGQALLRFLRHLHLEIELAEIFVGAEMVGLHRKGLVVIVEGGLAVAALA